MGDMADYYADWDIPDEELDQFREPNYRQLTTQETFPMLKKTKSRKTRKVDITITEKPTLVKCGKHLINPKDVRCITQVRKDLYVVKFFSEQNPEYATWVEGSEIANLLNHFNVMVSDS